jgi:hypothetical protein
MNEVMTENEALTRIDILTREREEVTSRLAYLALWHERLADLARKAVAAKTMQRPGVQNGLAKLDTLEAQ